MPDAIQVVCPHCATTNRVPAAHPGGTPRCGSCHAPLFTGQPTEVDEAGLDRHLRLNTIPVLLDIWASWCGPCRMMAPAFAQSAARLEPGVRLLKLNADAAPTTCARLNVRGIPAMLLFQNGTIVDRTTGAMDADAIIRWTRHGLTGQPN